MPIYNIPPLNRLFPALLTAKCGIADFQRGVNQAAEAVPIAGPEDASMVSPAPEQQVDTNATMSRSTDARQEK